MLSWSFILVAIEDALNTPITFSALVFRMLGVFVCLLGTNFSFRERVFTMIAYTPKATVQAAIGGIPLSLGLGCGDIVLTVAVLAIIFTAPLGAFAIDLSYKKLLGSKIDLQGECGNAGNRK